MPYVILDPCGDYARYIVEFLARCDRRGIAVFTDPGKYWAYQHMFAPVLGGALIDEYLIPEWPDPQTLAARIHRDHPGPIEGIIPWDEMSIELGAELGEVLGVDWNSRDVMRRFRNKFTMKSFLRRHGRMRMNASQVVKREEEAFEFQRALGRWPVVVKPSEGAGSRGVRFAHDEWQLMHACEEVFRVGTGEVLLEEFLGGEEYVVNGIVDAHQGMLITDVWRYDKRESHGVPNIYFQTLKVDTRDPVFHILSHYAGEVVECLGLRRCPVHMELKLDQFGPCLVEVGARFGGGNQPLLASQLHERSLFELAACHYLAKMPIHVHDVSYERYDRLQARIVSGVQTHALPMISAVHGLERVETLPSFHMFGMVLPPGMPLPVTTDVYTRPYEVYLLHEDPAQIEADALEVRRLIQFV